MLDRGSNLINDTTFKLLNLWTFAVVKKRMWVRKLETNVTQVKHRIYYILKEDVASKFHNNNKYMYKCMWKGCFGLGIVIILLDGGFIVLQLVIIK